MYEIIGLLLDTKNTRMYHATATLANFSATVPSSWGPFDYMVLQGSYFPLNAVMPWNYVAFGDSIVRFDSNGAMAQTWPNYVFEEGLVFGGGYAKDSATSAIVLAGAKKINADVGIIMVGVNDIAGAIPLATTQANVVALANKVQTDRILLSKIAPYNTNKTAANAMNVAYESLATANGWDFFDPWAAFRDGTGGWTAGASSDGVHPNLATHQAAALVVRAKLYDMLEG
jgi:lysophospholipase L1-like esterase